MGTVAIYAGSFDPITRGHEDLIHRSCEFVDKLVVAVANNSAKKPLFTPDERVDLIRELRVRTIASRFGSFRDCSWTSREKSARR